MSRHPMPFGATLRDGNDTSFRLWAPAQRRVWLGLDIGAAGQQLHEMRPLSSGWHGLDVAAPAGTRYAFRLEDGRTVPDPASRSNPEGVHAASEVVDPDRYAWQDGAWTGRPWFEAVICEIHIGTLTEDGTFSAAAARLEDLVETGYTAVELMPLAAFAGERGWGYDGVLPFAPHARYGPPDALRAFVDRAHALGLMVLLDVVYNHFGPEGNHLHAYAPQFFTRDRETPWGVAIDFDGAGSAPVRDFFRHNALYWIEEFHLDGLRIDAVHGMVDESPTHIVCEIAQAVRDGPGRSRRVHVVLENDLNQSSFLETGVEGAPRCATAQWNDDFHHAAHVVLTGEVDRYYADYATNPLSHLARTLAEGFAYQGEPCPRRGMASRGEPSVQLPSTAFVAFLQNHDQIGNRAFGDRLSVPVVRWEAMYVCLLLAPHVPMLFMGEEFAASSPFLYFCDFGPELAEAVSKGRRAEFELRDDASGSRVPGPEDVETFRRSVLNWAERSDAIHAQRLDLVRRLLALRRQHLTPRLAGPRLGGGGGDATDGLVRVCWRLPDGSLWRLFANFGAQVHWVPLGAGAVVHTRGVQQGDERLASFAAGATAVTVEAADPR